jgi:hypothetical protein
MGASLDSQASAAAEGLRALERALAQSRSQWNDSVRNVFDQHYAEPVIASGRRAVNELADLARELKSALRALDEV